MVHSKFHLSWEVGNYKFPVSDFNCLELPLRLDFRPQKVGRNSLGLGVVKTLIYSDTLTSITVLQRYYVHTVSPVSGTNLVFFPHAS